MKWSTPWLAMVGHRGAIMEAAGTRWTLLVGGILVLSASLARKYDTMDLLDQPHELLHGVAAAMVNALGLHLLFWLFSKDRPRAGFVRSYLSFLGVFMLAAPMGWVYGMPYEYVLPAPDAVRANLWSLASVSVLRVLWMTRVMNVLWGVREPGPRVGTFFAVMIYCDAVAILALLTMPMPTLDVMGGLQRSEEEQIVAGAAFAAGAFAVLSGIVWLIGGLVALVHTERRWSIEFRQASVPWVPIGVATAAVAAWMCLLPAYQPVLRNRTGVERLFAAQDFEKGVAELCAHERRDYPPVWRPPPALKGTHWPIRADLDAVGRLLDAFKAQESRSPVPTWVADAYRDDLLRWCGRSLMLSWRSITNPEHFVDGMEHNGSSLSLVEQDSVEAVLRFVLAKATLTAEERRSLRKWVDARSGQEPGGGVTQD